MRIRVVSDLHVEFHRDGGATLVAEIVAGDFDVLVVAGDLSDAKGLRHALRQLAFATLKPIVYVLGNHEFYGSDRESVRATLIAACVENRNLDWLDCGITTINGQRFVGAPLWFSQDPTAPKWAMNDFAQIRGFESWVYAENRRAREMLNSQVRRGDIVITHHLPHRGSVHPKFARSALNPFFLCDMSEVIEQKQPALWIHGHTHGRCDYQVGATRVVCNPHGYLGYEETGFDSTFTVEV